MDFIGGRGSVKRSAEQTEIGRFWFFTGPTTYDPIVRQVTAAKKLDLVDSAAALDDLKGVSDFHGLKGDRAGEYALHVNGNWCVTFTFDQGDANHLNFEDYHRR